MDESVQWLNQKSVTHKVGMTTQCCCLIDHLTAVTVRSTTTMSWARPFIPRMLITRRGRYAVFDIMLRMAVWLALVCTTTSTISISWSVYTGVLSVNEVVTQMSEALVSFVAMRIVTPLFFFANSTHLIIVFEVIVTVLIC